MRRPKVAYFFDTPADDVASTELFFIQSKMDVIAAHYPTTSDGGLLLAAVQLQEQYGDCPKNCRYLRADDSAAVSISGTDGAHGLAMGLPQVMNTAFFGGMGAPEARLLATEAIVLEKYLSLKGMSRYQARCTYLDYVKSSRVYGAHFFAVEPQNTKIYPSHAVIGINAKCFLVIDPVSQVPYHLLRLHSHSPLPHQLL